MSDPNRREHPDSWPRDRPIRWGALGRNLSTFAVTSVASLVQFGLVVPVLTISADAAGGWLRTGVALFWGLGTVLGRLVLGHRAAAIDRGAARDRSVGLARVGRGVESVRQRGGRMVARRAG